MISSDLNSHWICGLLLSRTLCDNKLTMSRYIGTDGSIIVFKESSSSSDTTKFLKKEGGTMSGELDMGTNKIVSLESPTDNSDATTKKYVDDKISEPNVINTSYTTAAHNDTITVSGNSITTKVNNALTTSELTEARKIIELNLSHHANYGASFFLNSNGLALFGQLDNLSGYVRSAEIKIIQPSSSHSSGILSSVQMMMSNETDPSTMSSNLTSKLTRSLSPGTYKLTPVSNKFTGLRFIGFFFEGGDAITQVQFTARIVLWIV